MSANQYRGLLDRKRQQRIDADKKAGEFRSKESKKRAAADKARQAASKATSSSTARTRRNEAERRDKEAVAAGKEANRWQKKAAEYLKEEGTLQSKLARAVQADADVAERRRKRDQQQAERTAAAKQTSLESRISVAETVIDHTARQLRQAKRAPAGSVLGR